MANALDKQIIEEGWRNIVVKLTGVLDSGDAVEMQVIKPLDFLNNDNIAGRLVGFRVDHVTYSIGDQLEVQLEWNANTPQQIVPLAGRGKIDVSDDGGFIPDMLRSGYDGSINLRTTGYIPGSTQNFTVFMRLVKLYKQ